MIEDRLLLIRFKRGDPDALRRIYEKYEVYLLTAATALLNDIGSAEDVLHDSFVAFAESAKRIRLEGNLRSFLATCIANRSRDLMRKRSRDFESIEKADSYIAVFTHIKGLRTFRCFQRAVRKSCSRNCGAALRTARSCRAASDGRDDVQTNRRLTEDKHQYCAEPIQIWNR